VRTLSEKGVGDAQWPVSGGAELGEFAFDVDLDGAEEVDVLAVRGGDVGEDVVVDAPPVTPVVPLLWVAA